MSDYSSLLPGRMTPKDWAEMELAWVDEIGGAISSTGFGKESKPCVVPMRPPTDYSRPANPDHPVILKDYITLGESEMRYWVLTDKKIESLDLVRYGFYKWAVKICCNGG